MPEQSPSPTELKPVNELEKILVAAQDGKCSTADFLTQLIESEVFLLLNPSEKPEDEDERNIQPLVLEGPDKTPMLVMFTDSERASPMVGDFPGFSYPFEVEFSWVVANASDGLGLVINPGWSYAASLPPEALAQLRNKNNKT